MEPQTGRTGPRVRVARRAWDWWTAAAVLTALRWVDLSWVLPMLQAGLVLVGLSLLPLLVLALGLRAWRLVAATAALGLVHLTLAAPWWTDRSVPPGDGDLVVASVNLQYGLADVADLVELVQRQEVDVLVLVEATPAALAAVDGSPLAEDLPHRSGEAREDAGGTVVLSREEQAELTVPQGFLFDQGVVSLASGPTVVAAHPFPPVGVHASAWRSELSGLGEVVAQAPDGPLVLLGDLNASTGHPALRQLLARHDLADAHREAGQGWVRTWPRGSVLPAFVQIDHVLVRGMKVVDAGTWEVSGSDHAAVWARLR